MSNTHVSQLKLVKINWAYPGTPIVTPHMALLLHFQGFPPIRTGQIFIPSDKGFKVKITTENL